MIGFVTWPPFILSIDDAKRWPCDKANHVFVRVPLNDYSCYKDFCWHSKIKR